MSHAPAPDDDAPAWRPVLLAAGLLLGSLASGSCAAWPSGFKSDLQASSPPWFSLRWKAAVLDQPDPAPKIIEAPRPSVPMTN